ncbi:MAG: hypothetical protein AAB851_03095, partial [Patescibacteria group bacterium]
MYFPLTKSKIFLLFCLSFSIGVLAASFLFPLGSDFESGINSGTAKGVIFLIFAVFLAPAAIFRERKTAFVVFICCLFAIAGFYRYADFYFAGENALQIRNFNDLSVNGGAPPDWTTPVVRAGASGGKSELVVAGI